VRFPFELTRELEDCHNLGTNPFIANYDNLSVPEKESVSSMFDATNESII
jgi:hypothetical protein